MANNFGTFLGALNVGGIGPVRNDTVQDKKSWDAGYASQLAIPPAAPLNTPVGRDIDVEAVGKQVLGFLSNGGRTARDLGSLVNMQPEHLQPVLDYLEKSHMIEYTQGDPGPIAQLTDFASEALRIFHFE